MILSQAITVIESNLAADQKLSTDLLEKIIHATGNSIRIGITGVPGVGKSSFIEAFGKHIISLGKKVAVLAVDPSSQLKEASWVIRQGWKNFQKIRRHMCDLVLQAIH